MDRLESVDIDNRHYLRDPFDESNLIDTGQPTHGEFESIGRIMDRIYRAATEGVSPEEIERRQQEYKVFLNTNKWHEKRAEVLRRAGNRCEVCGKANTILQVHHLRYSTWGEEPLEDLILLCEECHLSRAHGVQGCALVV